MEIKSLAKSEGEKFMKFLHENARNVSKPKTVEDKVNQTPKEDGFKWNELNEIDICFIDKYKTCSVKCYYAENSRKTYKFQFNFTEYPMWVSFQYSFMKRHSVSSILGGY